MKKVTKIILISSLIGATILLAAPFSTYLLSYRASQLSLDALASAEVRPTYYYFEHRSEQKGNVVFYPGGLVYPESYGYVSAALAERGFDVYLTRPLFNLAIVDTGAASSIVESNSSNLPWIIGGHSLGGTSAAFDAFAHPDRYAGLFFLASYPAASNDFSSSSLPVLSITGTADLILRSEVYQEAQALLNEDLTTYVTIDGGNHSQFGAYGLQRGDGTPTISVEAQTAFVVDAINDWFLLIG